MINTTFRMLWGNEPAGPHNCRTVVRILKAARRPGGQAGGVQAVAVAEARCSNPDESPSATSRARAARP